MFEGVFHLIDNAAHVIGWCTIVFGIVWFINRVIEDKRLMKEHLADREDQAAFEFDLEKNHPHLYSRYDAVRLHHIMKPVHWHQVAAEAGIHLLTHHWPRPNQGL
jgi:hypothetical protein